MTTRHSAAMDGASTDDGRAESVSSVEVIDVVDLVDDRIPNVSVLGPLAVVVHGRPVDIGGPKPTVLLALLVSQPGIVVSSDALIDGLWGDDPPPTARKAVQVHVSNLRHALGEEFPLRTSGGGYLVDRDEIVVDAVQFEDAVAAAGAALEDEPAEAARSLRDALAWWRGPAYAGLADCDALAPTIARLAELRLRAQSIFYEARLRLGQHVEVVGDLDALTTDHPFREDLRRLQMLALYRSGRQTEALRVYTRTRNLLVDELGIEPSAELRELQGRILDQSPDLDLVAPAVADGGSGNSRASGYELRQRLAADDVGVVYSAYQTSTGREVAIKVILPEHANRPEFVERFEADAQHIASLEHPHIVALYDYWRSPEGAYLVMPYVRGGNLRRSIESTRWDPAAALRVLDQIGSALGHAHRRGIVHGDLDSNKVLLDDDANAYLFDFGIARRGRVGAGDLDTATDIRAFGRLVHELFTGARSGVDEPLGSVRWSRDDLPAALDEVIARTVGDDSAARYERLEDCLRALRQACGTDVTTGPAEPAVDIDIRNPFKGLRAFAEVDADDYYGRGRLVAQLHEQVAQHRLTVVVGPSGSGKSSLVKAGLLPMLRRDGVRPGRSVLVTEMYPGSYPFEELEAALLRVAVDRPADLIDELAADDRGLLRATKQILPDDDSDLVLVVDQFEELFSLTADASVRQRFLDNLVTIGRDERSQVRVVLTMRADFFDRPLEYPAFGELMAESLVTVAMPDHDDLAQAISEPAWNAGLELEAGLVPIITRDVAGEPGALPLMQYALTELVGARVGRMLTIEAYERTGGVIGALSSRAEDIFVGLPGSAQRVAEEVFVHLVAVNDDSDDTRRRVRRSELDAMGFNPAALDAVIAAFGSFRLLSFDRDPVTRGQTIEVAHEALIREWPRFRQWIDRRREGLMLQRRLQVAAADWESSRREASFLLRGGRLEQFERWAASTELRVGPLERDYLDEARRAETEANASAGRRRHRLLAGFGMLAAVAVAVAALAVVQRGRADDAASLAESAAAEADAQRSVAELATTEAEALRTSAERRAMIDSARAAGLAAVELADDDPEAGVLVGLHGAALADEAGVTVPEVIRGLWEASSAHRMRTQHIRTEFDVGPQQFDVFGQGVSPSPDSRLGVSTVAQLSSGKENLLGSEVAPTWSSATTVTDLDTGETVSRLVGDIVPLDSTWDPTTGQAVTANGDGSVTWWDPSTGEPIRRERLTENPLWHVTLDAAHLATSEIVDQTNGTSNAVLRDRSTLEAIATVPGSISSTLSPNGRWWATASIRGEIVFHDATTGAEVFRTRMTQWPQIVLGSAAWAGQDDALWVVRDGALYRIDLAAGGIESLVDARWLDDDSGPPRLASSPDGGLLALGASNGWVFIRRSDTFEQVAVFQGPGGAIDALEWLPDGSGLVSVDSSGTALAWELRPSGAWSMPGVASTEYPVTHAHFADDSVLLAGRSGAGVLVDASDGETIVEFGVASQREDVSPVVNETVGVIAAPIAGGVGLYDVGERAWTRKFLGDGIELPLALSDDGERLLVRASASAETTDGPATVMIDTTNGDQMWRLGRFFADSALVAGDKVVVSGYRGGRWANSLLVLDASTGEVLRESTRSWAAPSMAVSPDGRSLATGRSDGAITIYDLERFVESPTGQAVVASTDSVVGGVTQVAYSADGTMLISAGSDGSIRAWDAMTLDELWSIDTGAGTSGIRVRDDLVWFGVPLGETPDESDRRFGLVSIPLDQASIADWAAMTVTRDLTDFECKTYLNVRCIAGGD
jgi:DNA-binding SARP family transcriptional activator/WD40 repeat protein/tRNA A-37 threonylcarbamoyl transferase component Bud32